MELGKFGEKQCVGKKTFDSMKLARRWARIAAKESEAPLHAYHCNLCGKIHIGHPTRWSKGVWERWRKKDK